MSDNNNGNGKGNLDQLTPTEPLVADVESKLNKFLDTGTWDGAFTSQSTASALEKLVDRGDKPEGMLLRGKFADYEQAVSFIFMLADATHFGATEIQELLLNLPSTLPSIGGERAQMVLDAIIGSHSNEEKKGKNWLRKTLGMDEKDKTNV